MIPHQASTGTVHVILWKTDFVKQNLINWNTLSHSLQTARAAGTGTGTSEVQQSTVIQIYRHKTPKLHR